jgi:hypothetical protein
MRCPFCGSDVVKVCRNHLVLKYYYECGECYARGPLGRNVAEAQKKWQEAKR